MKKLIVFWFIFLGIVSVTNDPLHAAHILEPMGTEISATPPRGKMFGQIEYHVARGETENGTRTTERALQIEFEIGVGERTQINLEAEVLLEEESGGETEKGIEEIALGLKHRFLDESETTPDMAFLVEFAPAAGLERNSAELKGTLLLTRNLTNRWLVHAEVGYLYETERESDAGEVHIHNESHLIYNLAPVYQFIPDQLLFILDLNGRGDAVTIAPEVIWVTDHLTFKLAVPVGVTDEAVDTSFRLGVSKLF